MAKVGTIKQLITDVDNVSVSSTKFWYNVTCLASTIIVIWMAYHLKLDFLMFLSYMACTGSMKVASDIIKLKNNALPVPPTK